MAWLLSSAHRGRRGWVAVFALALGLALVAFLRFFVFIGAPSSADVAKAVPGALLLWDAERSLAVFEIERRVYLDRVVVDRSPRLDVPFLPRWRLTGDRFSVPVGANQLASAGNAPHDVGCWCGREAPSSPVHVFGVVTADEVAFIALEVDGGWERYPVGPPGFLIPDLDAGDDGGIRLQLLRADGSLIDEIVATAAAG